MKYKIRIDVRNQTQLHAALALPDIDRIYAPIDLLEKSIADELIADKSRIIVKPPVFLGGEEKTYAAALRRLRENGYSAGLAHTAAHIELLTAAGFAVHGGHRLNITNTKSLAVYTALGLCDCICSIELKLAQAKRLKGDIRCGIMAYGKLPVMITRRCPVHDRAVCADKPAGMPCRQQLTDRKQKTFLLLCDTGSTCTELCNPDVLVLSDKQADLAQFDFAVLWFTDETDVAAVVQAYRNGDAPTGAFTRGLLYRGVL